MQATAEIKKGEQVFISYGTRSDDEMIADYGFCLGLDDSGIVSKTKTFTRTSFSILYKVKWSISRQESNLG